MDIRFHNASGGEWRADCVLVFSFEEQDIESYASALWAAAPWLAVTPALRDFRAKSDEMVLAYGHPELGIPRVLFCGLGKKDAFTMSGMRNTVAKAIQYCRSRMFAKVAVPYQIMTSVGVIAKRSADALVKETVISALLGRYRCKGFKSEAEPAENEFPRSLTWLFTEKETPDSAHKAAREGEAEAHGMLLARTLINTPANLLTPTVLAERAVSVAKKHQHQCTILDKKTISDAGMGCFLAVSQGSVEEPKFIVLEHCPKGKENDQPVVFVGKGITFDTGGISLKPPAKMHEMKGDMGGAAAVIGLFETLGQLANSDELPRVVGLIPVCENMPDGRAVKPGDVITTMSGKTVEILNTDAEGRLILCDALTYAQKHWIPKVVVDIATLTGACVVALGDFGAGLFTEDKELRRLVMDAADLTGDLFWPLPLWNEYDQNLKSDVADFTNMGPREGGALHAALFLRRFINKETRWAHLDIAGPGYVVQTSGIHPVAGGTGVGVRIFCEMLRNIE